MVSSRAVATCGFVVLLCVGCAEKQAQRAVQVTMTGLAHALDATDAVVDPLFRNVATESRERVVQEREENRNITFDEGMHRYRELMDGWYQLIEGLVIFKRTLLIGQSALDIWVTSGNLSDDWIGFCSSIGDATSSLVTLLGEVGVNIPESLSAILPHVGTMCNIAMTFVMPADE